MMVQRPTQYSPVFPQEVAMALCKSVEVRELDSVKSGMVEFYTPQASDETILVRVAPNSVDDMFVHRHQTDRLIAVRGSMVLVVLQNRKYSYIPMSDRHPLVVTIPPMVPHAAINFDNEPCMLINAVNYHGEPRPKDYQPMTPPFVYDLAEAQRLIAALPLAS
jgi:mannose-6-phosphate isomerase-like protein (cupin superfamily)